MSRRSQSPETTHGEEVGRKEERSEKWDACMSRGWGDEEPRKWTEDERLVWSQEVCCEMTRLTVARNTGRWMGAGVSTKDQGTKLRPSRMGLLKDFCLSQCPSWESTNHKTPTRMESQLLKQHPTSQGTPEHAAHLGLRINTTLRSLQFPKGHPS